MKPAWFNLFRHRLTLLLGGLSLGVAAALALYIGQLASARMTLERGIDLSTLARSVATLLATTLAEREREMQLLSVRPMFVEGSLESAELRAQLDRLKQSYRHYAWVGVASPDGKVRAGADGVLQGESVAERPWFKAGLSGLHIGDAHQAVLLAKLLPPSASGEPLRFIDFAAPIHGADGHLRGVVATHVVWDWVTEVLLDTLPNDPIHTGVEAFIVNRAGEIIHPYDSIERVALPLHLPPSAQHAVIDWPRQGRYLTTRFDVKPTATNDLGWKVVIRQPVHHALEAVTRLQHTLWALAGVLTIVVIGVAYKMASDFSRPIERLAQAAQRIAQGDETFELTADTGSHELRTLTDSVRGMTTTLLTRKHELEQINATLEHKVQERTAALEDANRQLERLASHDPLTGLHNRRSLAERLRMEFLRMKRSGECYAVLLVDVDHFKRVNDTYGHDAGDEVLKHIASTIRQHARATDFVARLGGEEFLLLLPHTSQGADVVAEKIRAFVEATPAPGVGPITISVGVAHASPGDLSEDVAVRAADAAMYQAKTLGRNRVVTAPGRG